MQSSLRNSTCGYYNFALSKANYVQPKIIPFNVRKRLKYFDFAL